MRPTPRHSNRPVLRRAAAIVAGAALLGACSPSVGATAGSVVVTDDEIAEATLQFNEIAVLEAEAQGLSAEQAQTAGTAAVARHLLSGRIAEPVFTEAGVGATDAEVREAIAASGGAVPAGGLAPATLDVYRVFVMTNKAASLDPMAQAELNAAVEDAIAESDAQISPRYATDPSGNTILPTWVATQWRGQSGL